MKRVGEGSCALEAAKDKGKKKAKEPAPASAKKSSGAGSSSAVGSAGMSDKGVGPKKGGAPKRTWNTIETQQRALNMMKRQKMSIAAVLREMGIPESTLFLMKTNSGKFQAKVEKVPGAVKAKAVGRGPKYPAVMAETARVGRMPVQHHTIQQFWRSACNALMAKETSDKQRDMLAGLNASEHWAKNFLTCNKMKSIRLHGEAGSVDDAAIAEHMWEIWKAHEKCGPSCIFNMDETRLFFKMLPR
ncbi:unnamed protein product [Discosporangium mesarthrocarpum]